LAKKGNGKKRSREHSGRPSMCEKEPGDSACLKQLRSNRPRICKLCNVEKIQKIKKRIFGL